MQSLQNIQSRMRGVQSTKQITNSMQLVSSSKVQHAKDYLESTKPFVAHYESLLNAILESGSKIESPYFTKKENGSSGIIVVSSDRGLSGGYNVNVAKKAVELAETKESPVIIGLGSRIKSVLRRSELDVAVRYLGVSERPLYEEAQMISQRVCSMYKEGSINELYIVYTQFDTMINLKPISKKLLPLESKSIKGVTPEYMWEPSLESLLEKVVPDYLSAIIFGAMAESVLAEQSSRVMSMDAASKNSDEIIATLNLEYNKLRQDAITQEITEIVSGANAVK